MTRRDQRLGDTPWFKSVFPEKLDFSPTRRGPKPRSRHAVLAEYKAAVVKARAAGWADPSQDQVAEAWGKSPRNLGKDVAKYDLPWPPPEEWQPPE